MKTLKTYLSAFISLLFPNNEKEYSWLQIILFFSGLVLLSLVAYFTTV